MTTRTQTYFIMMAFSFTQVNIMNSAGKTADGLLYVGAAWMIMAIISSLIDYLQSK